MLPVLILSLGLADVIPARPVLANSASQLSCPAEVVALWDTLVLTGCNVESVEGQLPTSLRLLRNTPFAARGHTFKSPELRTFFTKAKQGCTSAWYKPKPQKVKLQGNELKCATKLRSLESASRKSLAIPKPMETFLIENVLGELVGDMKRAVKGQDESFRVRVRRSDDGGWRVSFDSVFRTESGDTTESSVMVSCDREGTSCRVDMAG